MKNPLWRAVGAAVSMLGLLACGDGEAPAAPPATPVLTRVTIVVEITSLEIGQVTVATVTALDQFGEPIAASPPTFESSAPAVAAISPTTSQILAISAGTAEVTANVE